MAGITGIGSGMDIKGMVEAIVSAEQAPKAGQLKRLEAKTTTQLTSLGQLKSAISKFQTALTSLNSPSSFLARAANSSDTKVLTVSASQSAQAGSYKVNVHQLASGSKVALAATTSDAKLNTGSVTIRVGDGAPLNIAVDASNNSLAGIRDAINKAGKGQGLSATIVTDDQGARLVLSSSKAGDGNGITVTVDETGVEASRVSLNKLAYSGPTAQPTLEDFASAEDPEVAFSDAMAAYAKGAQTLAVAQSAKLTIDGLAVTRDSNSISDVVAGLSFELKGTGPSDLVVTKDEAGVAANVKSFVDAYNSLMSFINTETKVTTVNDSSAPVTGALVGDASVRALVNSIRSELVSPQGQGTVRALADMGITTKKDGTLEMNSDKVKKAISEDFEGVAAYFTGDTGLAGRLEDRLKPYTDGGGILASRTDALQKTIEKVDKQKVDLTARMKALEDRLYKQYNAMDSLVSQLMKTSDSLTQLFDSMPGFVTQNK